MWRAETLSIWEEKGSCYKKDWKTGVHDSTGDLKAVAAGSNGKVQGVTPECVLKLL